jgi:hypothetical protein
MPYQRIRNVPPPERIKGGIPFPAYQKINMRRFHDNVPPEVKRARAKAKIEYFKKVLKENW